MTVVAIDRRRNDTRQRIVEEARRLIGAKGYQATTVADLEAAVGLRPGAGGLYRHFASKEAVLVAVLEQHLDAIEALRARQADARRGAAVPVPRAKDRRRAQLEQDLVALAGVLGDFNECQSAIGRLTQQVKTIPSVQPIIAATWDAGYGMFADLLVHYGVAQHDADVLGVHALGAIEHFVTRTDDWNRSPLGVDLSRFTAHWMHTCASAAIDAAAQGGGR